MLVLKYALLQKYNIKLFILMRTNINTKTSNFDLDINNYTINDLKTFLKLPDRYNLTELSNACKGVIKNISQSEQHMREKNNIILFVKKTKKILEYKFNNADTNQLDNEENAEIEEIEEIEENEENTDYIERVSYSNMLQSRNTNPREKILLPLSNHQPLQSESIKPNNISGYGIKKNVVSYVFNTQLRDNYFNTIPSNCSFSLPTNIDNVLSVELTALQIPNVMLAFSSNRGTNQLYIAEDNTGDSAIVIIPDGNYSASDFETILTNAINQQVTGGVPRFSVTTNTFTMNIILKNSVINNPCNNKEHSYLGIPDKEQADPKKPYIPPSALFNTMGYNIGYRKILYVGQTEYTGESNYNSIFTSYVYFAFNDYNNYQQNSTVGVLPNYQIKGNILGIIPLSTPTFTIQFNNTSDFINRIRTYYSPVSLSKFSVQMLNQYGEILDLNLNDYAFCLEITTLYNISNTH